MTFTIVFLLVALLILLLVFFITLHKKGWDAALFASGVALLLLSVTFVITINIIVSTMSGDGM